MIKMATQSIIKNNRFEVLTENGWQDFEGLVITHNVETIQLDKHNLTCTRSHKVKLNDVFVSAETLEHTTSIIQDVYDLINVSNGNHYITNEITSHNCLYIDEAAFINNDVEFFESTYPVISSGKESRVIMTSTPKGQKGTFYKTWSESLAGKNEFKNMLVTWDMVPGRDEKWKQTQINNTSLEQFQQEFGCHFRGSQNSLLSSNTLETLIVQPVVQTYDRLKIYNTPVYNEETKQGHQYVICVDTSRGVGKDYSAFTVFDISTKPFEVVATFRDNYISPLRYPYVIENVAKKYNNAFILVEINDIGGQVADTLFHDIEYENIFSTESENRKTILTVCNPDSLGIRTNTSNKTIGISTIKTLIERGEIILKDASIIDEFGTFVAKGKSYEADKDCNDDMVMTCVMFGWLTTQKIFEELADASVKDRLVNRWKEEMNDEFVPFGVIDSDFGTFDGSAVLDEVNNTLYSNF